MLPSYSAAPGTSGFNIDPLTGKQRMLPTTRGAGPLDLHSLLGAGPGSTLAPGISGIGGGGYVAPGAAGAAGAPGAPAAAGAPGAQGGGASPVGDPSVTAGPNPGPGVDASGQLPSYVLNQFAGNISGALKGELPEDVQNLLAQQSAEYGVGSGTQGSQFQGYRGLRNLGLTSLDRMQKAEDLIAGQFTKPGDKIALDQSAKKIADLEDQFNKSFGLEKQKLEAQLRLEKDKFAADQNQLVNENRRKDLEANRNDLAALGVKYGGGSGGFNLGSYSPLQPSLNKSTGVTSYY